MLITEVKFLGFKGTNLTFNHEERDEALHLILDEVEKAQKRYQARLVTPREVKRDAWPLLLEGGNVVLEGGCVAKKYAMNWRATTSLFEAVSRKRGERVSLSFWIRRGKLLSHGCLPQYIYLPLTGLYAWVALGQEERMRESLGKRTSRKLRAMGLRGGGLLMGELPGGAALILDRKEGEWTLSLGLPGVGVLPLKGWSFTRGAEKWAMKPSDPPDPNRFLRWLKEEYRLPRGITLQRLADGAWGRVAEVLAELHGEEASPSGPTGCLV